MSKRDDAAGILHELIFRVRRERRKGKNVELVPDPLVSVVCVSNRPHRLDHLLANYERQAGVRKELILVTNADGYGPVAHRRAAADVSMLVIETAPAVTLGAALNLGVRAATGEVVAKFDDDDCYAASYLADAVATMARTGAGVIGKKTYFAYLESSDRTVRLFEGNEERRVGRLTGGTIVAHRTVCDRVSFDDVNLGEDGRFVRAAERAGFVVFSGSARGFLQIRGSDHTWRVADERLLADGAVVGSGRDDSYWM